MKIILGLGNPGQKYEGTRHNAGFMAINNFQKSGGFSAWQNSEKFQMKISEGEINNDRIILAKPQTFMNLSGQAAAALTNFYKIDSKDLIVVHDDLDLALGVLRVSQNSSAAGHNGVQSIIEAIGTQDFVRLRLGIKSISGSLLYKGGLGRIFSGFFKPPAEKFVLQKFSAEELKIMQETIKKSTEALKTILTAGPTEAMNRFN